jgi:hypothetical protein
MGLIPSYCRTLIKLHKNVRFQGPVLTLGNQDVWANYDQLKTFFDEIECPRVETVETPHTSNFFRNQRIARDFVHARTFFSMMGVREYFDIDKFEDDEPQILHDLNTPVPQELWDKFGLIIDGGTLEHIFDVRQVMENIARMSRTSGWVVHITPASNYVDHGLYSFNPCFFYDFYSSNGFGDFVCHIFQVAPDDFFGRCTYFDYSYGMDLSKLIDPKKIVVVFFAARKITRFEKLVIPTQGGYRSELPVRDGKPTSPDAQSARSEAEFASLLDRFVPAFLLSYLKPIRPLMGSLRTKVSPPHKRLRKI